MTRNESNQIMLDPGEIMDSLNVGIGVANWPSGDPSTSKWVYVNKTRCRMSGHTQEELIGSAPFDMASRETRPKVESLIREMMSRGEYTFETMLLRKDETALPVECHLKLLTVNEDRYVMIEYRDQTQEIKIRDHLKHMEENTRHMLSLIEQEKEQLRKNIAENLGQVVMPLLDQARETPAEGIPDLVSLLKDRMLHLSSELGMKDIVRNSGTNLTRRQRLICEMIQDGMTTKGIANSLGCSVRTVDNHRNVIRKKFGLTGSAVSLDSFLAGGAQTSA